MKPLFGALTKFLAGLDCLCGLSHCDRDLHCERGKGFDRRTDGYAE